MEESSEIVTESKKKPSRGEYFIAVVILLFILAGYIYWVCSIYIVSPESKKQSEIAIRATVSLKHIRKVPEELTNEDFVEITDITLSGPKIFGFTAKEFENALNSSPGFESYFLSTRISDLSFLEKFTNLERLSLTDIPFQENENPKWIEFLVKHGIVNLSRRNLINLKPLTKLKNLRNLSLSDCNVKSFKPIGKIENLIELDMSGEPVSNLNFLKGLKNLQILNLKSTKISDIKCLAELQNMEELYINKTMVSDISPLKELKKLKRLEIPNTKVVDLETLRNLPNLQILYIYNTAVSNIEPLMEINSLQRLHIRGCPNIKDQQVKELQKALPELLIYRM